VTRLRSTLPRTLDSLQAMSPKVRKALLDFSRVYVGDKYTDTMVQEYSEPLAKAIAKALSSSPEITSIRHQIEHSLDFEGHE